MKLSPEGLLALRNAYEAAVEALPWEVGSMVNLHWWDLVPVNPMSQCEQYPVDDRPITD